EGVGVERGLLGVQALPVVGAVALGALGRDPVGLGVAPALAHLVLVARGIEAVEQLLGVHGVVSFVERAQGGVDGADHLRGAGGATRELGALGGERPAAIERRIVERAADLLERQ